MRTRFLSVLLALGFISFFAISQEQQSIGRPVSTPKPETDTVKETPSKMRTLFGKSGEKTAFGAYIAGSTGYAQINGEDAILMGGRIGIVIDHHFAIGFAGNSFVSNLQSDFDKDPTPSNYSIAGGYGGIFIEPIILPNSPVHIAFPIFMGVGAAAIPEARDHHDHYYDDDEDLRNFTRTPFFVIEPGIELELNLVKFIRLGFNASYRQTSDLNLRYTSPDGLTRFSAPKDALRGFSGGMSLKFGWF
jgi:hypothetical protein